MDLIITILPVVSKDLPISPRFTPYNVFYRDASSALLQLVNQWLNFTYSRSHAFRYERKNTNPTLVRIELTTSCKNTVIPQVGGRDEGLGGIFFCLALDSNNKAAWFYSIENSMPIQRRRRLLKRGEQGSDGTSTILMIV